MGHHMHVKICASLNGVVNFFVKTLSTKDLWNKKSVQQDGQRRVEDWWRPKAQLTPV
jgi:hypothetical protein